MHHINHLPDELLLLVFAHLDDLAKEHGDWRYMSNAGAVCGRWCNVGFDHWYRSLRANYVQVGWCEDLDKKALKWIWMDRVRESRQQNLRSRPFATGCSFDCECCEG